MTPDSTILARGPADLIEASPYILGFHPADSLVVMGLNKGRVAFAARYDLSARSPEAIAHLCAVITAQNISVVALLAYGPPESADPLIMQLVPALLLLQLQVGEAIRVHDGRWWSYYCRRPGCCPPEGTPISPGNSAMAAELTYRGQVALPNREALVAQVAPVEGEARQAMIEATARACDRMTKLLSDDRHGGRAARRAGRAAVREAEKRYRAGRPLTDDEVAWLGVALIDGDVNEYALDRVSSSPPWLLALWTDVLRRVDTVYAPAPGCLLGYAAWLDGNGALARVAVDRALMADPRHRLAGLLDDVLGLGVGPHAMRAMRARSQPRTSTRAARPDASGGEMAA